MADQRYFQGHPNGFDIFQISTQSNPPPNAPQSIVFGSNRQHVGWTEGGRAYLKRGLWDSEVKILDGDRAGQVFAVDCSPIAAFANPSYIMEGRTIIYHNAIEGTLLVGGGSSPEGKLDNYEFDLEEFKEFAGSWNDRHCFDIVGYQRGLGISHPIFGTYAYSSAPKNNTIFPPLKSMRPQSSLEPNPLIQSFPMRSTR